MYSYTLLSLLPGIFEVLSVSSYLEINVEERGSSVRLMRSLIDKIFYIILRL